MKLTRARVTNFKSIDDSGWVAINDVTCLVGKNESGKTAFLHALRRLNPVSGVSDDFDLKDYPRKGYVRYKRTHADQPATVIQAEFELSRHEIGEIEAAFGRGVLKSSTVIVSKDYKNQRSWDVEVDEGAAADHIADNGRPSAESRNDMRDEQRPVREDPNQQATLVNTPTVHTVNPESAVRFGHDVRQQIIDGHLERALPRFVYFDNYSAMRGRISIQDVLRRKNGSGNLDDADRTFLALLSLVGADLEDLENQTSYEYLKAELESASIAISDEIFAFWRQNRHLRIEIDLSSASADDPPPLNSGTILHVRIWNNRHRVSVPFDERSKGFVWFFSFLSYFSKLEEEEEADLILLLDEPGLNLHAMAQNDFVRFIEERLASKHQVLYTTHSPFMINLEHLRRVRTVQDVDNQGTVISNDVLNNDRETVFPVQVALGYQMAQTLLLAPHCLMVNASSDLIYLQVLGEVAASRGRARLDPRWVVIPVGDAANLPTFVSLLGESYVSVAVLMDVTPTNRERVETLNQGDMVAKRNPIKWVDVTKVRDSDIEDLLDPEFYLKLVNESYAGELPRELTLKSISESNPRIVRRTAAFFQEQGIAQGQFDPYRPAAHLLQNHDTLRGEISDAALERVASLFQRINLLLPVERPTTIANEMEPEGVLASTS